VAADHPIQLALLDGPHHGIFEIEDEIDGGLYLALGVTGQGPVAGEAQAAAEPGQAGVDAHQQVVSHVPQHRHPAVVAGDLIEFVPVDQQQAFAVGGDVDVFVLHPDTAEIQAVVGPQGLIVIAGNEHDLAAVAGPAEDFLDHGVLGGGPVNAPAHGPEIHDVADQVKMVGRMFPQEIQ